MYDSLEKKNHFFDSVHRLKYIFFFKKHKVSVALTPERSCFSKNISSVSRTPSSKPYSVELNSRYGPGVYPKYRRLLDDGSRIGPRNIMFLRKNLDDERSPKKERDCGSQCNFHMGKPNKFNNKEKI